MTKRVNIFFIQLNSFFFKLRNKRAMRDGTKIATIRVRERINHEKTRIVDCAVLCFGNRFTQVYWGISGTHHTLRLYPYLSLRRGAVVALE